MGNFFTKYKKINDENDKKVIYVKMKFNNGEIICYSGDKAIDWLHKGAEPTDTVRALLSYTGVLYKKHLQRGVAKGAVTQDKANELYSVWVESKDKKV
jgi:small subunit ribosomal protein S16